MTWATWFPKTSKWIHVSSVVPVHFVYCLYSSCIVGDARRLHRPLLSKISLKGDSSCGRQKEIGSYEKTTMNLIAGILRNRRSYYKPRKHLSGRHTLPDEKESSIRQPQNSVDISQAEYLRRFAYSIWKIWVSSVKHPFTVILVHHLPSLMSACKPISIYFILTIELPAASDLTLALLRLTESLSEPLSECFLH